MAKEKFERSNAGTCITQKPIVEKGQKVKLTISNGKFKYMDNYVGKDYDTVFNLLSDTNFKVNVTYVSNDEYAPGTIIKQSNKHSCEFICHGELLCYTICKIHGRCLACNFS